MKTTITSIAPGRICLFGDHQDYLGLPIIACAINRYITLTATPNNRQGFVINAPDIGEHREIPIRLDPAMPIPSNDHFLSALRVVARKNCIPRRGYDITIQGTIPINAGISSSSALVVAWVQFLYHTFVANVAITPHLIADSAYQAEVVEHHSPGGKMDQYTSALGKVLYLETDEQSSFEQLDVSLEGLIIGESGIPKDTLGLLAEKKQYQLEAVRAVKNIQKEFLLQHARIDQLSKWLSLLPTSLQPYLTAAMSNYDITKKALVALKQDTLDYAYIGKLMNEHHHILSQVLGTSEPRIDTMVASACEAGAYGAKIVGSGGGGCLLALAPKGREEDIIHALLSAGAKKAYTVQVDRGARIVTMPAT